MTTYKVQAEPDGRWWHLYIPAIDRHTQAKNVPEIETMAKDLIAIMAEDPNPTLEIEYVVSESISEHLRQVEQARAIQAQARQTAAAELRKAAKELRDENLSLSDVGAILGVSHQRASQLVNA